MINTEEASPAPQTEVILIEENRNDAQLITKLMSRCAPDAIVRHIDEGSDAMRCLQQWYADRRSVQLPKLILTGLRFRKIQSDELVRQIKHHPMLGVVPLIALTGVDNPMSIGDAYRLGVNGCVRKPVEFDELNKMIKVVCSFWLDLNSTVTMFEKSGGGNQLHQYAPPR